MQLIIARKLAPGSDLHVFLAVLALSSSQQRHGVDAPQAEAAQNECYAAVRLRYGPAGQELSSSAARKLLLAASRALERVAV
jgi:hypothetical protein